MPTALIQGRIAVQFKHLLRKELDDSWNIHVWDPAINDREEFVAMAYEADAIIGGTHVHPSSIMAPLLMPKLFDDRQARKL